MVDAVSTSSYNQLQLKLKEAKNKQGVLGQTWNSFKEGTGLGQSYSDCKKMVEKYKDGEISMTEAMEYIQDFEDKQDNIADLKKNIITGTAAITATTIAGVTGLGGILLLGAAVGAATKTVVGLIDRGTNKVKNDEFDAKTIAKDVISGATTGAASALPSGKVTGDLKFIKNDTLRGMVKYGTCSALCGATSGAIGYTTDVALNEDKQFDFGELVKNSATSAVVSGTVGAGLGAFQVSTTGGKIAENLNHIGSKSSNPQATSSIGKSICDSLFSSIRKIFGRNVNDGIKAVNA